VTSRVIVTGGSGFIGRHLCQALSASDFEIVPADAEMHTRADALVHLAFPTGAESRRTQPGRALADTLATTGRAIALADAFAVRHVVLASTGKVYAPARELPITESHPTGPTTFLGELKLLVERSLELAAARSSLGVTSLRIFNVFGPGQRGDFLIARLLEQITTGDRVVLGELDHARDWLHVRDVCSAIVCALRTPAEPGRFRALNVASGRATSARQIVTLVEKAVRRRLSIEHDPARARPREAAEERASAAELCALGWALTTSLEAGIEELFGAERL
jgi:nucleoside-diphosphate-sugar epimerase